MTEMIKIVFPYKGLSSALGTKFFLGDKELNSVISFSIDPTDSETMLTVNLKFILSEVEYASVNHDRLVNSLKNTGSKE